MYPLPTAARKSKRSTRETLSKLTSLLTTVVLGFFALLAGSVLRDVFGQQAAIAFGLGIIVGVIGVVVVASLSDDDSV